MLTRVQKALLSLRRFTRDLYNLNVFIYVDLKSELNIKRVNVTLSYLASILLHFVKDNGSCWGRYRKWFG